MKKPIALFFALSASLALGSMVPACGGDDDTTGSGGSSGSGGSGGSTGGKGGSGGSTGGTGGSTGGTGGSTGGSAGKGGSAGGDAGLPDGIAPVQFGTKTCQADTSSGLPLAPCCPPGETDTCGFDVLGTCLTTTPGTPDPLCRDQPSPIPGIPGITGCCRPNGLCGGTTGAPIGCNDFSQLGLPAVPCGPDAAPPPPPDSGPGDTPPPPPPDSGPMDVSNDRPNDNATGDAPGTDGTQDAPAEGGGSDGATDANNDSAG
jgi:hypothetical protein